MKAEEPDWTQQDVDDEITELGLLYAYRDYALEHSVGFSLKKFRKTIGRKKKRIQKMRDALNGD